MNLTSAFLWRALLHLRKRGFILGKLTQRDILKKWIMIIAGKNRYSIHDIVSQIKNWIPQWKIPNFHDENCCEYNWDIAVLSQYDIQMMENEIISADSAIYSSFRQKTGSFYTPVEWAKYMVRRTLNIWLCDVLDISYKNKLYPLESGFLSNLSYEDNVVVFNAIINCKIIDIACGSGVFLISVVREIENILDIIYEKIYDENNKLDSKIDDKWCDRKLLSRYIIANVINGWDINSDALALYSLWVIYRYGIFDIADISPVVCNDSLSDKVMLACNKYDIVIGNPPYLGEKGNKELFEELKNTQLGQKHYCGKMDLSYFFVARALELLKDKGLLTYIMTNYFITADGAQRLRQHIKDTSSFVEIFNLNTASIFSGAKGQHNIIYTLKKGLSTSQNQDSTYDDDDNIVINQYKNTSNLDKRVSVKSCVDIEYICDKNNIQMDELELIPSAKTVSKYSCKNAALYRENGNIILYSYPEHMDILRKYEDVCDKTWGDIFEIKQGIVSGADRLTRRMMEQILGSEYCERNNLIEDMPIFVFDNTEVEAYKIEKKYLKPFYKNSDISRYIMKNRHGNHSSKIGNEITRNKAIFIDDYTNSIANDIGNMGDVISNERVLWIAYTNRLTEQELEQNSPNLFAHLQKFKKILSQRREVKSGSRKWYELQWGRDKNIFDEPAIVVPHRNRYNKFAFVAFAMYGSADIYYFQFKKNLHGTVLDNWYYHLAMANSSIMYMWLYNYGKKKGDILELYGQALSRVKIPDYNESDWQKKIVKLVHEFFNNVSNNSCNIKREIENHNMSKNSIDQLHMVVDKIIFDELGFDNKTRKIVSEFAGIKFYTSSK